MCLAAAAGPLSGSGEGEGHPFDTDAAEIRRRSIVAYNHGATHKEVDEGLFPTNDQVVQALQLKVAKSVDIARRYRRVLWYSLFVAVYLVVLYLQASAYKSADVVSTLRNALMVDGQLSMTFNNEDEVLAYIGNKILLPTWQDPVCGDGVNPHSTVYILPPCSCCAMHNPTRRTKYTIYIMLGGFSPANWILPTWEMPNVLSSPPLAPAKPTQATDPFPGLS